MYVSFEKLGHDARIWVYHADRKFRDHEIETIEKEATRFIDQWTAHGNDLQGSFKIIYDQFLILGVDEDFAKASGCSIDSSVQFIRKLEALFNVNFLDRSKVAILIGDMIVMEDFNELKNKIKGREIKPNDITFNNFITKKSELDSVWQSSIADSWLKKYL